MIFKVILVIDGYGVQCQVALIWTSMDLTNDKLTLVQVMAWCREATSHYLSQCWSRSLLPYGVIWPKWVKMFGWAIEIVQEHKVEAIKVCFVMVNMTRWTAVKGHVRCQKLRQFAIMQTCKNWVSAVNSCIHYACHTHDSYQIMSYWVISNLMHWVR